MYPSIKKKSGQRKWTKKITIKTLVVLLHSFLSGHASPAEVGQWELETDVFVSSSATWERENAFSIFVNNSLFCVRHSRCHQSIPRLDDGLNI